MPTQALEQILEFVPTTIETSRDYGTIDVYTSGAAHMDAKLCDCGYSGCPHDMMAADSLNKPREPLTVYDMPSGGQIHLHSDCAAGNIQGSGYKIRLDSYQSAMVDLAANNLGFPKTDTFTKPKKY